MQLLKFVPIKLTLLLVLGIILGFYFTVSFQIPLAICLLLILVLAFIYKSDTSKTSVIFGTLALVLSLFIGALAISIANPKNWSSNYTNLAKLESNTLQLKITDVLKSNSFSDRYYAKVTKVNNVASTGKSLLIIPKDSSSTTLKIDQELVTFSEINEISAPLNPHAFNYKKYLESIGIYHQLYVQPRNFILLTNHSSTIYGFAAKWRNSIIERLKKEGFKGDELGVIQALLLGERNDISEETFDNYKNAGAIHILAVSGLHIGILLLMLQFILKPVERIKHGKVIKLILIIGLLWSFALLAGLSASVVRAVMMFTFLAYAESLNRPSNKFNTLALSMFVILLFQPNFLFQVGFQMSYLAVFAILWIYPMLQRFWFPKNILVRYFWQLFSVSIAAQLGVLPISLFYFHQFPGLFFITNLVIIPFLGFILAFGILVILLSLLQILPKLFYSVYYEIIRVMNSIVEGIAQQETFIFKAISFDVVQLLVVYCGILFLVISLTKPAFKKITSLLLCIIAFQFWLLYSEYTALNHQNVVVLHQSRYSGILQQNGKEVHLLSNTPERFDRFLNEYSIAQRTKTISRETLKNSYLIGVNKLYIMDSLAIYPPQEAKITHLLLTQSPKVNLKRLLDSLKPAIIIADGSNYKSDIRNWEATCEKRKLPFHYTGEKGAYYFKTY